MRSFLSGLIKRGLLRRNERGQSVILLAIGFIALAAFVGITTDVSLAFVRYAQLSRAVDSAAIAAANQMRQNTSIASVGLAARQFIEFHGLNPEFVGVDTCMTAPTPGDPELCTDDQAKLVRVVAFIKSPTVFMRLLGFREFDLWASAISQTAALDVVIIFDVSESMLRYTSVADWSNIRRIGESFQDQVFVGNMATIYRPPVVDEILTAKGLNPAVDAPAFWQTGILDAGGNQIVPGLLNHHQSEVNARLFYTDLTDGPITAFNTADSDGHYRVVSDTRYFANRAAQFPPELATQQSHPREECTVRFFPSARSYRPAGYAAYRDPVTEQAMGLDQVYNNMGVGIASGRYDGFVPAFNYYGCCNDPNGDGSFSDLVCQPFKQARDATFQFLERIDFVRGDRAAFVTFDRTAFIVNPYGELQTPDGQRVRPGAMLDSARDAFMTARDLIGVRAEPNFYVYDPGVVTVSESGGQFIPDSDPLTARWSGFSAGQDDSGNSIPVDYGSYTGTYNPVDGANPSTHNYPVNDNCPFRLAAEVNADRTLFDFGLRISLPRGFGPDSDPRWDWWHNPNNLAGSAAVAYQVSTVAGPGGLTFNSPTQWSPNTGGDQTRARIMDPRRSYEFWASCRGTNMGAALREGNNALVDPQTVRRFGTVWVMILLSDGGAGASDPVRRNGEKLQVGNPYQLAGDNTYGVPGQYGSYGLCPFGVPSGINEVGRLVFVTEFPYCSDAAPQTRHQCDFRPRRTLPPFNEIGAMRDADYVRYNDPAYSPVIDGTGRLLYRDPATGNTFYGPQNTDEEDTWNRRNNNMYDIDLADCDPLYDVDDYARDWADYIGLASSTSDTTQLPTIFTIGFGLEFSNLLDPATGATLDIRDPNNAIRICELNPGDCIGESLLRYIADVGDNNQIDNDWWQDWLEEPRGAIDGFLSSGSFGPRDPCQRQDQTHNNGSYAAIEAPGDVMSQRELDIQWGPLPPKVSCGNYFYAPDGNELQFVFDEIASRMFTRLAR